MFITNRELLLFSVILLCISRAGIASDFSVELVERIEYSDNIKLSSDTPASDTIFNTGVILRYKNDSERYPANIELSAVHRNYEMDSYQSRNDYFADIYAAWLANHKRAKWEVRDKYRRVPVDTLSASTPDNQENVNYFSTGPSLDLVKTRRSRLVLDIRYENFDFGTSNLDRIDYLTGLGWVYRLTSRSDLGLNWLNRDVRYEDVSVNENYKRNDYYVSLAHKGATYTASLELGETSIRKLATTDTEKEIVRFKFKKELSQSSSLTLSYNKEVTDYSVYSATIGSDVAISTGISDELFSVEQSSAGISKITSWGGISFLYIRRTQDYAIDSLDYTISKADVSLSITASSNLNYKLEYAYEEDDWLNIDRNDTDSRVQAKVIQSFAKSFMAGLTLENISHQSNQPVHNYDESRAILDLTYKLF